jgi:predicted GNAT family acetyltransferase
VSGSGHTADQGDLEVILRWLTAFADEAVPGAREVIDREAELGRIRLGGYLLWTDGGGPVSLAGVRSPAAGVGRIGPVYTPPEHRRRRYAAAVTSFATQRLLDAGARAMLFTDLANPTSNGVYARLGYELVGEMRRWSFH